MNGACSVCGIAGGTTGTGGYVKVESEAQFTSGKYVLVVSGYAPKVYDSSTKWLTVVQPTISNNTISDDKGAVVILTVDGDSVKLQDANGAYLAPSGGNNNGIKTGEYSWAWEMTNGTIQFKGTGSDTVILAANKSESYKIRAYKTTTANNETNYPTKFTLYKWVEDGVGGGDSGETECAHSNTTTTTVNATCTEAGSTTVTCVACGETVSTTTIPATGHSYGDWVTVKPADCTENGEKSHTCAVCSNTENETIAALGHTTEKGVCDRCQETIGGTTKLVASFELGANGSASHSDGSSKSSYSETDGDYTLTLNNASNMYTSARDAKGNSCIKLGASSKTGGFSFTVASDVTKVVVYIAGYKANTVTVKVNGTNYVVNQKSDNGEYLAIEIDTSTTKTVTLATTTTGYRAMVNTIEFYA